MLAVLTLGLLVRTLNQMLLQVSFACNDDAAVDWAFFQCVVVSTSRLVADVFLFLQDTITLLVLTFEPHLLHEQLDLPTDFQTVWNEHIFARRTRSFVLASDVDLVVALSADDFIALVALYTGKLNVPKACSADNFILKNLLGCLVLELYLLKHFEAINRLFEIVFQAEVPLSMSAFEEEHFLEKLVSDVLIYL